MEDGKVKKISKFLSLVLRHKPEVIGLAIDEKGWADVKELIKKSTIKFDLEELKYVVDNNDKKRFSFNDNFSKIKAAQGHSIDVKIEFKKITPPDILYHGTATKFISSILKNGLVKGKRNHVHLSKDTQTASNVGKRHGNLVILQIDSKKMDEQGVVFLESDNGVVLTDFVSPEYIEVLQY